MFIFRETITNLVDCVRAISLVHLGHTLEVDRVRVAAVSADRKPRRLETHSSIINRKFRCHYIDDTTTAVNLLSTCLIFILTCLLLEKKVMKRFRFALSK